MLLSRKPFQAQRENSQNKSGKHRNDLKQILHHNLFSASNCCNFVGPLYAGMNEVLSPKLFPHTIIMNNWSPSFPRV